MKIQLSLPDSPYFIRSYRQESGIPSIILNRGIQTESFALHQDFLLPLTGVKSVDDLDTGTIQLLAERKPTLLILGTGDVQQFLQGPLVEKLSPFTRQRIGIETMKTEAAVKTYNILAEEGRDVMGIFCLAVTPNP